MAMRILSTLEQAVVRTIAYADLFDYPLQASEVYRYLEGTRTTLEEVTAALQSSALRDDLIESQVGLYSLAGRAEKVGILRRDRAMISQRLWPLAYSYGRKIAGLPFIRMVAVTGALAMDNEDGQDIDYLIVTAPGRLWLCRALVILLVRHAAQSGVTLCPNYILTERALVFSERNLYTAHELTQMVPLAGLEMYARIRNLNYWTASFLPNAVGLPHHQYKILDSWPRGKLKAITEAVLRIPPVDRLESWEMRRKLLKFGSHLSPEAGFCSDWCKGHFGGYEYHTLEAFDRQMSRMQLKAPGLLPIDL